MSRFFRAVSCLALLFPAALLTSCEEETSQTSNAAAAEQTAFPRLDNETSSRFSRLALKGITREYPNKLEHVMNGAGDVQSPRTLHPAFYGSYDWHSSVHGHWMLVRLLKISPDIAEAAEIRSTLDRHLTAQNIATEVTYMRRPGQAAFERTYGWVWVLALADELAGWDDPDGTRWSKNLAPLADTIALQYMSFLPKQTYPIRRGVHPNTAFGMTFALDYARTTGRKELENLLLERSRTYFGSDKAYPAQWEPDGDDFLSSSLEEADLMRRVLAPPDFARWFHEFLPGLERGEPRSLLEPAIVSDRTDPKLGHLDGLNMSRAWCMRGIASALPANDPARPILLQSAAVHARASLPHIASGNYLGEHWLASFAVYMMSEGEKTP